jgi:hypothetical protein
MNKSSNHLKRSVGAPFWIGCLVGPILCVILLAALGIFHDSYTFWFFAFVAVIVFGPIGGVIFQVAHDLIAARRLGLLHVWDYAVFGMIAGALLIAGFALYHTPEMNPGNQLKNGTFVLAVEFVAAVVLAYAVCRSIARYVSRQPLYTQALRDRLPQNIRAFAAGGFTFMFFQGLVLGLFESLSSIVAGKPAWLMLAASIVFGGVGVTLGLALLRGSPGALRVVRLLLLLTVAGGSIGFVMSILQVLPHQSWNEIADVLVSLALLIVINKQNGIPPVNHS